MIRFLFLPIFLLFSALSYSQYEKTIQIEPILKTDTTVIGQRIIYPQFDTNEVSILKITIGPNQSTGWHKHDIPVFAYVLEGTLTVEFENHETKLYPTGFGFAEVTGIFHKGTNYENKDLVLIAFYLGAKGKPLSVKKTL